MVDVIEYIEYKSGVCSFTCLALQIQGGGGFYTDGAYSASDGGSSIAGENCVGYRFLKFFEEMHFCHCERVRVLYPQALVARL